MCLEYISEYEAYVDEYSKRAGGWESLNLADQVFLPPLLIADVCLLDSVPNHPISSITAERFSAQTRRGRRTVVNEHELGMFKPRIAPTRELQSDILPD